MPNAMKHSTQWTSELAGKASIPPLPALNLNNRAKICFPHVKSIQSMSE